MLSLAEVVFLNCWFGNEVSSYLHKEELCFINHGGAVKKPKDPRESHTIAICPKHHSFLSMTRKDAYEAIFNSRSALCGENVIA